MDSSEHDGSPGKAGLLGDLSRRAFITRGSITAAAVGFAAAVPGLSGLVAGSASEAPALDGGAAEAESGTVSLAQPLLAQVKDLSTGEISLFQGEQEIVVRNPALARQILAAANRR
jgi:hypothetical protein